MALVITPLGNKSGKLACTNCPASLIVTGPSSIRLRVLAEQVSDAHSCGR